jgi:hypothetical protein
MMLNEPASTRLLERFRRRRRRRSEDSRHAMACRDEERATVGGAIDGATDFEGAITGIEESSKADASL